MDGDREIGTEIYGKEGTLNFNTSILKEWLNETDWPRTGIFDIKREIKKPISPIPIDSKLEEVMEMVEKYGQEEIHWEGKNCVVDQMIDLLRHAIRERGWNIGEDENVPWCASFVYACLVWCGCEVPPAPSAASGVTYAYCPAFEQKGRETGVFIPYGNIPRRGDIVLFAVPGKKAHHIGFVSEYKNGRILCTEGNGNQGQAVYRVDRTNYNIRGYLRVFDESGEFKNKCLG